MNRCRVALPIVFFLLSIVGLAALLTSGSIAAAESAPEAKTVDQILDCVVDNTPDGTARQEFKLLVHDRSGGVQTMKAKLHWKRGEDKLTNILVRLSAPADLRGSSYLLIEREEQNDMFAYLPELRLVRRVTGRHSAGSVFGSDFSYEDMQRLYNVSTTGQSTRLPDVEIGGRKTYVIETLPNSEDDSAYRKTLSYVDHETCVALKTEFFEKEDNPRKTLLADASSLTEVDGVWIPKKVRIEDVRTATHTELVVEKIEFDVEIPDRMFTRSSLERKGR